MRMRLRIIPVALLIAVPDFIAVALDADWPIVPNEDFIEG